MNLRQLFEKSIFNKYEIDNNLYFNYLKKIQTQRNKNSIIEKTQKKIKMNNNINSNKNNINNKILKAYINIENDEDIESSSNFTYKSNLGKLKKKKYIRNEDLINININSNRLHKINNINKKNHNFRMYNDLIKKQSDIQHNKTINNINNTNTYFTKSQNIKLIKTKTKKKYK